MGVMKTKTLLLVVVGQCWQSHPYRLCRPHHLDPLDPLCYGDHAHHYNCDAEKYCPFVAAAEWTVSSLGVSRSREESAAYDGDSKPDLLWTSILNSP